MLEYYIHYFPISGVLKNATTILPLLVNMYVHGTYQSDQRTCRPDRVFLIVGSGVSTAGGGGNRVSLVAVTSIVTESSMCTGFRQSSDITSCLPLTPTVNVLAPRSMTLSGPWYGCSKVWHTASCCRKILVHRDRWLLANGLGFMWWWVGVARSCIIISFNLVTCTFYKARALLDSGSSASLFWSELCSISA